MCEHSNVGLVSIQYHHKAGTLVSTVGFNSRVPLITILGKWLLGILFFSLMGADGYIDEKIIKAHNCNSSPLLGPGIYIFFCSMEMEIRF